MKTIDTPQRTLELMRKGFALVGEGRYADALQIGRKLKRLGHFSAFEIMALAHLGLDELPKAIATLEEGVAKAGRVLWELLGNCYSDAGSFKKADQAYTRALLKDRCYRDLVYHKTRSKALRLAFRAVEESLDNAQALALIRELLPAGVARPRFFRLLIHGIWDAPLENWRVPPGFFRTVEVAASSPQAELDYAKPFFPKAARSSLALEEIKVLRRPALIEEGVYFLSAFHLYPRKKKA